MKLAAPHRARPRRARVIRSRHPTATLRGAIMKRLLLVAELPLCSAVWLGLEAVATVIS